MTTPPTPPRWAKRIKLLEARANLASAMIEMRLEADDDYALAAARAVLQGKLDEQLDPDDLKVQV